MKIFWSAQAFCDLRAIRDFIARDSEHYAHLQIDRLISRVERTAAMPTTGHPVHGRDDEDVLDPTGRVYHGKSVGYNQ